jgi:hypothetical protein
VAGPTPAPRATEADLDLTEDSEHDPESEPVGAGSGTMIE